MSLGKGNYVEERKHIAPVRHVLRLQLVMLRSQQGPLGGWNSCNISLPTSLVRDVCKRGCFGMAVLSGEGGTLRAPVAPVTMVLSAATGVCAL